MTLRAMVVFDDGGSFKLEGVVADMARAICEQQTRLNLAELGIVHLCFAAGRKVTVRLEEQLGTLRGTSERAGS